MLTAHPTTAVFHFWFSTLFFLLRAYHNLTDCAFVILFIFSSCQNFISSPSPPSQLLHSQHLEQGAVPVDAG